MRLNGLMKPDPHPGLVPMGDDSTENQPAINVEQALKNRREKLAQDKLRIPPEITTAI